MEQSFGDPARGKWSEERAWAWYNKRPWIRGFNGYPSNCVSRIAMWQQYKHKEVFDEIRYEFGLAKETGFNAVRAIIQFEVWYYEHDSFMANLEEYIALADEFGLGVMLTLGNDGYPPKAKWKPVVFGEQPFDLGYHSGIKTGPYAGGYTEPGYSLIDEPEFEPHYYEMVEEIAARYAKDERLLIWDVWNEPGMCRRDLLSLRPMENFFAILRSHDPIQPLTASIWSFTEDMHAKRALERRAAELSDVITFHSYRPYADTVLMVETLKADYGRPLLCTEWLHRILGNTVEEIFPLFYLERVGAFHWGLIAGLSQTYEPWGSYFEEYMKDGSTLDLTKWQHDLYRFNGLPYDPKEIRTIRRFCEAADRRDAAKNR
ncbi:MAG: cellulase family glycosylhydrolase [Ruminococcus sp.]|nr:cellulase family glycosylhydrolase [Candidatus Apopatosoma intestinale]